LAVGGVIGRGSMDVAGIPVDPADGLARPDQQAPGPEPDVRPGRRARHADFDRLAGMRRSGQDGRQPQAAARRQQQPAARIMRGRVHFATRLACAAGTFHSTMWMCGSATPGCPALYMMSTWSTFTPAGTFRSFRCMSDFISDSGIM